MKDPGRLVHDHPSPFARSLLSAAMDEEPQAALLATTLKIASGSTGLVLDRASAQSSAAAPQAAQPLTPVATASASSAAAKGVAWFAAGVKWVGIASVGGVVALSGIRALQPKAASSHVSTRIVQQVPSAAPQAAEVQPLVSTPEPAVRPASEAAEPIAAPNATRLVRPTASSPAPASSSLAILLSEEARVIDEARAAVARGDGAFAIRLLENHRKRFERPRLRPEALYLRMQALRLLGNTDAAARIAERLLQDYPDGPQSASARALLNARGR